MDCSAKTIEPLLLPMQSYLQFRRAGQAASAQVKRGHEKSGYGASGVATPASPQQSQQESPCPTNQSSSEYGGIHSDDDIEVAPSADAAGDVEKCHSETTALGRVLTGVLVRDRHASEGTGAKVFLVGWDGPDDRLNPRNWSLTKRIIITMQISLIGCVVGVASAIDATVLRQAAEDLGVAEVAESMATGLYLVGIGLGALVAGPFSETFGRNAVYTVGMLVFMIWIMAAGLAPNFGAQIVFRLLAGCSASTPIVCAGGSVADMYDSLEKTWSFPLYTSLSFGGPMLGAVMGAYIGPSSAVSWRWVEWTILLFSGLILLLVLFFMPETYGPLLLQWKASHLRRVTGDPRFLSEHEIVDATLLSRLKTSMTRPFVMVTEPIIAAMTLYLSVLYIVLFTFFVGWPYIFEKTYGIGQGISNITFISMFIGTQAVGVLVPFIYQKTKRAIELSEGDPNAGKFSPEIRLWYAMLGPAISIPISLFWMGWTDYPHVSIWSPIVAAALFGFGITGVFLCTYMYIIDSYEVYSASALTFISLTRYLVAGGMTIVGVPFYGNMGTHYTLTIMACISVVNAPIPYILYFHGHRLRRKSKFAVTGK